MTRPKVFLSQPMHQAGIDLLAEHCDVIRGVYYPTASDEEIATALADADAVMIRSMPIDAARMDLAPNLKVIAKHGAGMDSIDIDAASARGVMVANSGDANAFAVAQHAVALMLAVQRRIVPIDKETRAGNYQMREQLAGKLGDLWQRTVGLVGVGNIGRHAAHMVGRGFNATVLGFDPGVSAEAMAEAGVIKVETLEELLRRSDIVSLHLPLTPRTKHIIGREQFAIMQKHAIIVNTARGGTIDEAALAEALSAGTIAGAGLDVLESEPNIAGSPLFALDQVIVSPHIGGGSEVARINTSIATAQAILAVFDGGEPEHIVNRDALRASAAVPG